MRLALAVATLAVVAALLVDMSGSAVRTAGSNHVGPVLFTAAVGPGGSVCQPIVGLSSDVASVRMTVGSYGKPMPQLLLRFLDARGGTVAEGTVARGAREGVLLIPVRHTGSSAEATNACLYPKLTKGQIAVAGESFPAGTTASERVDNRSTAGRISLYYFRAKPESWWQMLPTLARRFGLGKAGFFGSWLLPLLGVALIGVWVATLRLLARELT